MTTLKKEIQITGNGLMKNKPCTVRFVPSKEGKIRYFVKDNEPFEALVENVVATDHCVVLGKGGNNRAMLTEHLTSALAFCAIDSLDIYMDEMEVPILDGSSKQWVELFKQAGIDKPFFEKPQYYTVSEPVYYLNGKTSLVIVPSDEIYISYAVNYAHKDLTRRWVAYNPKNQAEIIEARTFGFYKDLRKFQMLGFAQGVTIENTLGLTDEGYTAEPRSENEPIKHKILDLIGDLYLTGVNPLNLKCQILVKEAGHAVHVKVAQMLKDKICKI
jgi:UDP-3-O-[3-hydroxymyristoyl] N-acetylglucosamine deacetylase